MFVTRCLLASIVWVFGIVVFSQPVEAAESQTRILEGVRWVGPAVTLEGLRGKTVVLIDYATWCPICNKWSGEACKQLKEAIVDKPVVVLAINNDEKPSNVKPYVEARDFLGPNIVHGYDPAIAKRNGLPDLWGYMIIDPEGKVVGKGHFGTFYGGDDSKVFVLPKKLRDQSDLGEFAVIDTKMSDPVKRALWPMELGLGIGELRKFNGEQKKQIDAALTTYGDKEVANIRKLAEGDIESQFAAYDRANMFISQFKGSSNAKEAKKVTLALDADAKFKRELAAKKAYERCEKMPAASSSRATALKVMVKRFEGTVYGDKAKEAVAAPVELTAKAGKQ